MVANKPVAGAPVESAWGSQVHDAAVLARGVTVSGGTTAGGGGAKLPLDTVINGDAAMADLASNEFICPIAGVYEVLACILGVGATAAVTAAYTVNLYHNGVYAGWGACAPTGTASGRRFSLSAVIVATAGQRVYIEAASNGGSGGTLQLERATLRLIAQAIG